MPLLFQCSYQNTHFTLNNALQKRRHQILSPRHQPSRHSFSLYLQKQHTVRETQPRFHSIEFSVITWRTNLFKYISVITQALWTSCGWTLAYPLAFLFLGKGLSAFQNIKLTFYFSCFRIDLINGEKALRILLRLSLLQGKRCSTKITAS